MIYQHYFLQVSQKKCKIQFGKDFESFFSDFMSEKSIELSNCLDWTTSCLVFSSIVSIEIMPEYLLEKSVKL